MWNKLVITKSRTKVRLNQVEKSEKDIRSEININEKVDGLLSFNKLYDIYKKKFVGYGVSRVALIVKQICTLCTAKLPTCTQSPPTIVETISSTLHL